MKKTNKHERSECSRKVRKKNEKAMKDRVYMAGPIKSIGVERAREYIYRFIKSK